MSDLKEQLIEDITKESGLTEREEAFLDALFDEHKGNVREAMNSVGYPKGMPTSAVTKKLQKQIRERAKEHLVTSSGQAAIALVDVLTDPSAVGAKNVIAATKEILDRAGIFKEEQAPVQEVRNMFILPAKGEKDLEEGDTDA